MTSRIARVIEIIGVIGVTAAIGGVIHAQATRAPVDASAQDALLTEIRGLRQDINRVMTTNVRAQLLVGRLQLQEQRVFTVGRQLLEVQNLLATVRSELAQDEARVKRLEDDRAVDSAERLAIQQALPAFKAELEQKQRREQTLRAQESELLNVVNDEQTRWTDFNERLDALERSLPTGVVR
jgi:chromosome segregation ATPase